MQIITHYYALLRIITQTGSKRTGKPQARLATRQPGGCGEGEDVWEGEGRRTVSAGGLVVSVTAKMRQPQARRATQQHGGIGGAAFGVWLHACIGGAQRALASATPTCARLVRDCLTRSAARLPACLPTC